MDSILVSVKKLLGMTEDYECFDADITMHINSVLVILGQMGIGPENGFSISSSKETWANFLHGDPRLEMVKSYVYLKVRMLFDPPQSSVLADAIKSNIAELEWRISIVPSFSKEDGNV